MKFKIRKTARVHAATETIHRRFANIGFQCHSSNTRMDRVIGRSQNDLGNFAL
ncbi:Uncharacterised protein [Shigella sonnei]|nr:Uncharacterised protein [Shigella sonnei]CSS97925.1 Uncharacterised protein [Shigella sonnei]